MPAKAKPVTLYRLQTAGLLLTKLETSMWLKFSILVWLTAFLCAACAKTTTNTYTESFNHLAQPVFSEKGRQYKNADPYWWLNSGAYLYLSDKKIATVHGKLAENDNFRLSYAKSNPVDTDNGYRPQNIFRLVSNSEFTNFSQQVFFNIRQINLSASPNRNQSNGVLLFNRYQDGDNLYYAGIRVDGFAVVKKKLRGKYYTLKSVSVYPGRYNRETHPNLLPVNRRIGLKSEVSTNRNGNVDITVSVYDNQLGPDWTQVIQVEDTGIDTEKILNKGRVGIRSDFMDVSFDGFEATEMQ